MYYAEKHLECSRNFKKYLMEHQLRCKKKKSARGRRPMKSAVHTSPENVDYLKRNQTKYDDAQSKKEKSINKRQLSQHKETATK